MYIDSSGASVKIAESLTLLWLPQGAGEAGGGPREPLPWGGACSSGRGWGCWHRGCCSWAPRPGWAPAPRHRPSGRARAGARCRWRWRWCCQPAASAASSGPGHAPPASGHRTAGPHPGDTQGTQGVTQSHHKAPHATHIPINHTPKRLQKYSLNIFPLKSTFKAVCGIFHVYSASNSINSS